MSATFEIVVVPPAIGNGSRFDGAAMENVFAGISGADRGRVLCTVEFGLACVRKTGSTSVPPASEQVEARHKRTISHGSHANGTNGNGATAPAPIDTGSANGQAAIVRNLLLKPKVILDSVKEIL